MVTKFIIVLSFICTIAVAKASSESNEVFPKMAKNRAKRDIASPNPEADGKAWKSPDEVSSSSSQPWNPNPPFGWNAWQPGMGNSWNPFGSGGGWNEPYPNQWGLGSWFNRPGNNFPLKCTCWPDYSYSSPWIGKPTQFPYSQPK